MYQCVVCGQVYRVEGIMTFTLGAVCIPCYNIGYRSGDDLHIRSVNALNKLSIAQRTKLQELCISSYGNVANCCKVEKLYDKMTKSLLEPCIARLWIQRSEILIGG